MASRSSSQSKKQRGLVRAGKLREPVERDLLSGWAEKAGLGREDLDTLVTWLARQMVSDQFAKLEQGSHQEGGIPLRKVFVDLPILDERGVDPGHGERTLFLKTLLALEPTLLQVGSMGVEPPPGRSRQKRFPMERASAGFVVIGGPGQGKSTLGQLACQVHRAALLAPYVAHLSQVQREVVGHFTGPAARKEIGWPREPLFPLHVSLPDAATWLAQEASQSAPEELRSDPALVRWLAERSERRGATVPPGILGRLLKHAPLLLVLDGFDEVGATEDRARLVSAIHEFLATCGQDAGRGIVVATTRPQGYAGELDRTGVPLTSVSLAPLRTEEALEYGKKLAATKLLDRPDDLERVRVGLKEAAGEPATARLLTTPLQVTILVALVQRMGRVPSERWGLFKRYFETIYDREVERGTYAAPLLREHRMHIERIHLRVGLLLQVESEQAGGADARLSRERLAAISDSVLAEDEIDEETRTALVRRIMRAAEERLVFLVEPEPGHFGFEIRSLQEMMASWALAADGDDLTHARLLQIAPASMFRNVTLLLASKFFTDGSRLRDVLVDQVCLEVETALSNAGRTARSGALLALEILEEGSVLNQPKYARRLMERACAILELPPCGEQVRLSRVGNEATAPVLSAATRAALKEPSRAQALGAWIVVAEAANAGARWAQDLGDSAWRSLADASALIDACRWADVDLGPWLQERIEAEPEKVPPRCLWEWYEGRGARLWRPGGWSLGFARFGGRNDILPLGNGMTLFFQQIRDHHWLQWTAIASMNAPPITWRPWCSAARFAARPEAAALATTLRELVKEEGWDVREALADYAPWPLAACLRTAKGSSDWVRYAEMAESGELGDVADWTAAQQSWEKGVSEEAFFTSFKGLLPWSKSSLSSAPPVGAGYVGLSFGAKGSTIGRLRTAVENAPSSLMQSIYARVLLFAQGDGDTDGADVISTADTERWVELGGSIHLNTMIRGIRRTPASSEWLDSLDKLGRRRKFDWVRYGAVPAWDLFDLLGRNPDRHGLLFWLRKVLGRTGMVRPSISQDLLERASKSIHESRPTGPGLQLDHALIRLWLGALSTEEALALVAAVARQAVHDPEIGAHMVNLTLGGDLAPPVQEAVLVTLLEQPDLPWRLASHAQNALRAVTTSRRSNLADPAVWRRLHLPLPLPAARLLPPQGFILPENPVSLARVEVKHVRGLADLSVELAPATTPDRGQWTVLLGPNGAGKTTLLRSIALALRDLADIKIWPTGTFETPWRANGLSATTKATIAVHLSDGRIFNATIQKNGTESPSRDPADAPTPFPIFAYGCRRGSALGGAPRKVNIHEDGGPEVATLFNEGASLIHAETWLKEWHGAAADDPDRSGAVYEAILAALRTLLAVHDVIIRERQVWVIEKPGRDPILFAAMSDGYLTTAGWFLDLVARFVELAYEHKKPLDDKLLERMTGLVLLDEIDLHLHPRWQIDVIPRVKRLLPRMSFVVTTHNPLTLVGAEPGEIWILSADGQRVTIERGTEAPRLLTGGQIYSQYFGIQGIYPNELGEALRRYGFLSGDPLRTDEEQVEMEQLREKLRAAGIEPGWEEAPREAAPPPPRRNEEPTVQRSAKRGAPAKRRAR